MKITLILMILIVVYFSTQSDVQELNCTVSYNKKSCDVNGMNMLNGTKFIKLSGNPKPSYEITFSNFKNFENTLFIGEFHTNKITMDRSNVTMQGNSNFTDVKLTAVWFRKSVVSLLNGGLSGFPMIKFILFFDSLLNDVETGAFEDVRNLNGLSMINTTITNDFIEALNILPSFKNFECRKCDINNSKFSSMMENLKMVEEFLINNNRLSAVNCSQVLHLNLEIANFDNNFLNETVGSCHIKTFSIRNNQVDTLYIQTNTTKIYATNNSIASIKCDNQVNLAVLEINFNNLSDLQCIVNVSTLEELNINSNKFTNFKPNDFKYLKKLKIISAIGNDFVHYLPQIFYTAEQTNRIVRININKFDFGYEDLKKFYPELRELFHKKNEGNCDKYHKILDALANKNVNFYYMESHECMKSFKNFQ